MIALSNVLTATWDAIGVELTLLVCFLLGFVVMNAAPRRLRSRAQQQRVEEKHLHADFHAGKYKEVWERAPACAAGEDVLRMALVALKELRLYTQVLPFVQQSCEQAPELKQPATVLAMLEALQESPKLLAAAYDWGRAEVSEDVGEAAVEVLVNAYLDHGCYAEIAQVLQTAQCPARVYARLVKDALKRQDLETAAKHMAAMQTSQFYVPAHLTTQLVRLGVKLGQVEQVLRLLETFSLSAEGLTHVLEHCAKESQMPLLERMLVLAAEKQIPLLYGSYDACVKAFAKKGDSRAFRYFDEMVAKGFAPTESTAVGIVTQCVEGRNVPLAEHVLKTCREEGTGGLALYSAMAKVFAACRQFKATCELYPAMRSDGVEPDNVMYGCLIKAAVECGRLDLSKQLLRQSGTLDIQNYMSLFRACGRERNARKVLELLAELEQSPIQIDVTAYNCVLDVLIKCGDKRAVEDLFTKMKATRYVDVISFNTLLKDKGCAGNATKLLAEMRRLHLLPNQVTYNSLINAAVSKCDMTAAWAFVQDMEQDEVPIDAFTCSIMLKSLKHTSSREDVDQTLALIARHQVVPDEVLVNTLLDACARMRDLRRLRHVLATFKTSGVVPSEHAYESLLRAYGQARCLDQAWATWQDMQDRKVKVSDQALQTMVDAVVQNGCAEDCVQLLQQVPHKATPQLFHHVLKGLCRKEDKTAKVWELYEALGAKLELPLETWNLLLDGFARHGKMEPAAQVFRDLCAKGCVPDGATYTTVIKGYAVAGELEQAIQLFQLMKKRDFVPDAHVFNALLDGCARKQMPALLEQVWADMQASGVHPSNVTLATLVKLYGKQGDLDQCKWLVDTLPKQYGFDVGAESLRALMHAGLANDDLALARGTFQKLSRPDAKAFAALIGGYLKSNVQGALDLLERAKKARVDLDPSLVENVHFMAKRRGLKC